MFGNAELGTNWLRWFDNIFSNGADELGSLRVHGYFSATSCIQTLSKLRAKHIFGIKHMFKHSAMPKNTLKHVYLRKKQ